MTRDEILALEGEALDKAVAEIRNDPPRFYIMAMDEAEEAYCADVSSDGPWYSERELREWLRQEHARGASLDYHIVKRLRYARYSDDSAGLFLALLGELQVEFDNWARPPVPMWRTDRTTYPHWYIVNVRGGLWSVQIRAENATRSYPIFEAIRDKSLATSVCRMFVLYREETSMSVVYEPEGKENEQRNL